ncbi:MAG TPA: hypothetical protein VLA29_09385 [Acidimicrobiia bacterium]|nr:hypothetical protein [Acidimicrobiia bacterium]
METKTLFKTYPATLAEPLDDRAIEALFSDAGLPVEVVDNCGDASCPVCFGAAHVRAA